MSSDATKGIKNRLELFLRVVLLGAMMIVSTDLLPRSVACPSGLCSGSKEAPSNCNRNGTKKTSRDKFGHETTFCWSRNKFGHEKKKSTSSYKKNSTVNEKSMIEEHKNQKTLKLTAKENRDKSIVSSKASKSCSTHSSSPKTHDAFPRFRGLIFSPTVMKGSDEIRKNRKRKKE